ncbi:MAG: hypothetical protein NW223_17395, partial [Hyphomicrobiaceae bacterium]|nr:hypothetical protein [Hyphomicrobiaceae bacterium]
MQGVQRRILLVWNRLNGPYTSPSDGRCEHLALENAVQDWAVGPAIPTTRLGEMTQRLTDGLQRLHLLFDRRDMRQGDALHL